MRKALDREHAKHYVSPYGRWDQTAADFMRSATVVAVAPLRVVAEAQGSALRAGQGTLAPRTSRVTPARREAARERAQAFVAANARPAPQAPIATVATPESKRERFARLNAMAKAIPDGRYALPRRADAGDGQSVYFFQVTGTRIVMLTGGVGAFAKHPMSTTYQEVALTKIAADPRAAAVRFGHSTSTCGRCGSPLTNDASVARGLGPDCAKAF
jgi:hypothetical protein